MIEFLVFLTLFNVIACDDFFNSPVYKYRYETEDVMKTAASNIPVHGYHVVEGGYYPYELGPGSVGTGGAALHSGLTGPGIGGLGGQYILKPVGLIGAGYNGAEFGGGGIGYAGPKYTNAPILIGTGGVGFGGLHHHTTGGEAVEKKDFSEKEKKYKDEHYDKKEGKEGGEVNHDQGGYSKGEIAAKDAKSDAGYYNKADGEKNVYQDEKEYGGGKHYKKEGKSEEETTVKTGHKKGHKIKSFKTTHHKDESGKTEEYYDEAHDEGGNTAFKGAAESSGEKGGSSFKGLKEEKTFKEGEAKQEGQYKSEHLADKADSQHGKYGENKYAGADRVYGNKNGEDEQSLLSHQESSKYYKSNPFVVPFHHQK